MTTRMPGWGWMLALFAGATLLRVPGLFTDLWLDEVWSLQNALAAPSWWDLIVRTKIDNNHHLNSLFLRAVGPGASAVAYRLLSFASGLALIVTAWLLGALESRRTAFVATLLFGGSYMLAFYASEARGYATVVWLTLAACYCAERYIQSPRWPWASAFTLCSVLGVMAHPTFVMCLGGVFLWVDSRLQRKPLRAATWETWRLFAGPVALIGVFYALALYGQEIGGGPPYRTGLVVARTLSAVSGGPLDEPALWFAAAIVASAFAAAISHAWRADDDRWRLYLASGVVIPAVLVVARQPTVLSPRYLIVPASVLLLAAARWLSHLLERGGTARAIGVALIAAHVTTGIFHVSTRHVSRGGYRAALERIVAQSGGQPVWVASARGGPGSDFRNSMLVGYYSGALGVADRVRYVTADRYPPGGAAWLIVEGGGDARPFIMDPPGHRFELDTTYPGGDLAGTTWHLYRRDAPSPP